MIPMLVSTLGVFLFQEASYIGYAITFYIFVTCLACIGNYFVSFLETINLHLFIERMELYIDTSKLSGLWNVTINQMK